MADWTREFDEPIPVPKGRRLVTLRDAGDYVAKLPQAEYMTAEWQAAMFALMLVVELNGPTMMARIGIMRALNRHVERVFSSDRKDTHWADTSSSEIRDDGPEKGRSRTNRQKAWPEQTIPRSGETTNRRGRRHGPARNR